MDLHSLEHGGDYGGYEGFVLVSNTSEGSKINIPGNDGTYSPAGGSSISYGGVTYYYSNSWSMGRSITSSYYSPYPTFGSNSSPYSSANYAALAILNAYYQ